MNAKYFLILLLSSLVVLHGCDEVGDDDEPTALTLADFLNNNKPSLQEFTVTAGTASTINGAKGCTINFGASSFIKMDGTPVTSGNVEIQLREVTTKKDMILSKTPTISNNELIVSQGVYYLKALQDGFELEIVFFEISKTVENPDGSPKVFLGSNSGGLDFNWITSDSIGNVSIVDSTQDSLRYALNMYSTEWISQNYNWINCDYFYDNTAPRVAVFFPTLDTLDNYLHQSYLVFNDLNAVLVYNSFSSMQLEFFNIPSGLNATLFSYYIVGGKAYVATADIVTSDALSTSITFQETTEQGLLSILEGL